MKPIRIKKQLGTKTAVVSLTLASILFASYEWGGESATLGTATIFAFLSFHFGLRLDETEQFPFLFVGFLCLILAAGMFAVI